MIVDDDERLLRTLFGAGQNREVWFLTEDGLYEALMQSRKPIAKMFKNLADNGAIEQFGVSNSRNVMKHIG